MRGIAIAIFALLSLSGCATGPYSPINSSNLRGSKYILIEQSDRVSNEALIRKRDEARAAIQAVDPITIVESVVKIVLMVPQIVESYSKERTSNALLGRRILVVGYEGEDLDRIAEMIRAFDAMVVDF